MPSFASLRPPDRGARAIGGREGESTDGPTGAADRWWSGTGRDALPRPGLVAGVGEGGATGVLSCLATAALVLLERPALVPVALAGFLVRGGIVVLLLPIVVLPTPVGLATIFGPDIVSVALAGLNPGVLRLAVLGATILVIWLLVSGWLGAAADVALIEATASPQRPGKAPVDDHGGVAPRGRWTVARVAIVRWLAHLPLVVALAWGVIRIVEATYAELVLPSDTATPLVLRVLAAAPDAVIAVAGAWLLGEVWGGCAARFLVRGRSVGGALWAGLRWLARAPLRAGGAVVATTGALVLVLAGGLVATTVVWSVLRPIVRLDPGGFGLLPVVVLLVGVWLVVVAVVGVTVAWRAIVWNLLLAGSGRAEP